MSPLRPKPIFATMFSGGRGCASIARHLLRMPRFDLSLVVNGYDNGLSTGALRRYLPGMLGPSDFRKNLLLHFDSTEARQAALIAVLRHRLPLTDARKALDQFIDALGRRDCGGLWMMLSWTTRTAIFRELDIFRCYYDEQAFGEDGPNRNFDLADCALGNLVFAGAYLRLGRDFNAAIRSCARTFGTPVQLLNVTNGENAFLVALKQNGRIIPDEADIVAPQDTIPITDLYLLRKPLTRRHCRELETQPIERLRQILDSYRAVVSLNPEAQEAIETADLIIYGPGTPHSSLLPSYLTPGITEAIAASRASAKVFVVNVRQDHDVRGLGAAELVDLTLSYLGDPTNKRRCITHVLCHRAVAPSDFENHQSRTGARWIIADLVQSDCNGVHCGSCTASALAGIVDEPVLMRLG